MTLKIEFTFNEDMLRQLDRIPEMIRLNASDRILGAMARPVVQRAKELAPSSRRTGTRKKWSQKLKNDPKWNVDSGKHISHRVLKGNKRTIVYIGARFPKGNKQQFDASEKGRRHVLWGKATKVARRPRDNPHFLQKAFDETKSQQIAEFNKALAFELKELKLG